MQGQGGEGGPGGGERDNQAGGNVVNDGHQGPEDRIQVTYKWGDHKVVYFSKSDIYEILRKAPVAPGDKRPPLTKAVINQKVDTIFTLLTDLYVAQNRNVKLRDLFLHPMLDTLGSCLIRVLYATHFDGYIDAKHVWVQLVPYLLGNGTAAAVATVTNDEQGENHVPMPGDAPPAENRSHQPDNSIRDHDRENGMGRSYENLLQLEADSWTASVKRCMVAFQKENKDAPEPRPWQIWLDLSKRTVAALEGKNIKKVLITWEEESEIHFDGDGENDSRGKADNDGDGPNRGAFNDANRGAAEAFNSHDESI